MKIGILGIILVTGINLNGQHRIDTTLAKRISMSGFCLCQTTLNDLENFANDFRLIQVEEMDLPKTCLGQDSRFTNGEGYFSEQFVGMIFQKEQQSDYISKIRLTKEFKGKLPDGTYIDLEELKLKDLLEIYPKFNNGWGSRGCSEYWKFSDDTISFYVKIDSNIKPQFPIKKEYYMDKPIEGVDLVISCYKILNNPQKSKNKELNQPLYYLDNISVNQGVLELYKPEEIAAVVVVKDSSAIKIAGDKGKNGIIYITTKAYAREKYWKYLSARSTAYKNVVPSIEEEGNVVYVLNNKLLESNYEGDLYFIDDSNFINLTVINKKELKKEFNISGKEWGIKISIIEKDKE